MPEPTVFRTTCWEDTILTVMARVTIDRASVEDEILQSDITSIAYEVYHGSTLVTSGTFDKTTTVFDTLQTGSIWKEDEVGFNFKARVPAAAFPDGNTKYRVEVEFTLNDGSVFPLAFDVSTLERRGS